MNRYIRTKDGIYVKREDAYIEDNILYIIGFDFGRLCLGEVIKQADTIEELCDMTIVVDDERPDKIFELEWYIDEELLREYNDVKGVYIYGAIWTNKGLIYVAKMNDKGYLELL